MKYSLDNAFALINTEVETSVLKKEMRLAQTMKAKNSEPKVVHATCVLERNFSHPAGAVFAALSDPKKIQQWMGTGEHSELIEFSCEFREGGRQLLKYKMGSQTPIPGAIITNQAQFQRIVENQLIVTASTMKMGEHIFSASQVTFELLPNDGGTDLIVTHQGAFFEGSDGPEMRERGWQALMDNLAALMSK